jgi:inosose dehydratase
MTAAREGDALTWAAQVITFYAPSFWDMQTPEQLADAVAADPKAFYDRLMDAVASSGVDHVELCMAPGDWRTALAAYGTPAAFVDSLAGRGLTLSGSYQSGWSYEAAFEDAAIRRTLLDEAARHAEFLAACGADIMLSGPPRRGAMEASIALPLSERTSARVAEMFTDLGTVTRASGVRLSIHTEAYSCVCREEDITSVLAATDPSLVHLCPDSGHVTLDGGDVSKVVDAHADRMTSMHWKDCIGQRTDVPATGVVSHEQMMEQFRRMGKGIVRWAEVVTAMRDRSFRGYAVAEIDLAPEPVEDVRDILDYFGTELSSIYR